VVSLFRVGAPLKLFAPHMKSSDEVCGHISVKNRMLFTPNIGRAIHIRAKDARGKLMVCFKVESYHCKSP
jgi:hypothetical protein